MVDIIAAQQLLAIVHRVESLNEEKADIATVQRDLFAEAKANGYDIPAIKAIVKKRKMIRDKGADFVAMQEEMARLYEEEVEKASVRKEGAA